MTKKVSTRLEVGTTIFSTLEFRKSDSAVTTSEVVQQRSNSGNRSLGARQTYLLFREEY